MYDKSIFEPNGGFFYNKKTRQLHHAILDDSGALDSPGNQASSLTFNLVKKTYMTTDRPVPEGSPYYDVLMFPDEYTMPFVRAALIQAIGDSQISFRQYGKTLSPANIWDEPHFVLTSHITGNEDRMYVREICYILVTRDFAAATQWILQDLKDRRLL